MKKKDKVDCRVLMIGQRRVGKSSVLSAMLRSMDKLQKETGICFKASDDTEVLMERKLSGLEKVFLHREMMPEEFTTISGEIGGEIVSGATAADISYRFELGLADSAKSRSHYTVEFTDIRGESMMDDLEAAGEQITDKIARSSVIIIAIDSPALMEETKTSLGYGRYHEAVNASSSIFQSLSLADVKMREKLKKKEVLPPRLILFVPLKCEKYYWNHEMDLLSTRVKTAYRSVFEFLKAHSEYSAAITPILTMGDVVFSRYEKEKLPSGREQVVVFGDGTAETLRNTPRYPLFRFRNVDPPVFSPAYCEQPLVYLLMYVSYIGQLNSAAKSPRTAADTIKKGIKHAMGYYLFGVFYLMFLGIRKMTADKPFMVQVDKMRRLLKTEGHGYEIVIDHLNLREEDLQEC